jgi:hypothetical protein
MSVQYKKILSTDIPTAEMYGVSFIHIASDYLIRVSVWKVKKGFLATIIKDRELASYQFLFETLEDLLRFYFVEKCYCVETPKHWIKSEALSLLESMKAERAKHYFHKLWNFED